MTRFPNYGWLARQGDPDSAFDAKFPAADKAHGYGNITVPGLRGSDTVADGVTAHRMY